jgi:hypothetical protein
MINRLRWGTAPPCPYETPIAFRDHNDGVEMIRHDDEFIQCDFAADIDGFHPFRMGDFPAYVQMNDTAGDFAEYRQSPVRDDCYETCARLGVIKSFYSNRSSVMD